MATDLPLSIQRRQGNRQDTVIFELSGPVTLRNLFVLQDQLRRGDLPHAAVLDLSGVPYMDSAGMGSIMNFYVHCQNRRVGLVIAGVSGRVMELFKMTRVDTVLSFASNVEEAEASV